MKSIITLLTRKSKKFHSKYRDEIKDIIVFGSLMRGKAKPKDIDIAIVFYKRVNKDLEYEFKKQVDLEISLISKREQDILTESFDAREGILFEGYSLVRSEFIASKYGFSSLGMFIYDTSKMDNARKTNFYYALNGRGKSTGVADSLEAIKFSSNLISFKLDKIEQAKEFFDYWEIEYKFVPVLVPKRLARKEIIGKVR